ncbi:hypothetical protein H9657_04520 [Cellulomonas sp. Sa3CUA2]|uniref:Uncharacterized protein n=1 Tax=Cellulomonas avistercoris TaxID=2762242 RepID=A0ABR8QAS7_9CELL|nr:hypothetical protein [Cellulomonas avistercoris]MBD7917543.1 hypothetical protein [Cellulomonas avistercoris]
MSSIMIEPGTMLPAPPLSTRPAPRYAGLGFAEVKPHNVRGILAGLASIQKHRLAAAQPYTQAFLLTYRHQPGDPAPRAVVPYLLVPGARTTAPARPKDKNVVGWLGTLGDWYALSPAPLPLPAHPEPRWGTDVGPVVRGSMVEPLVRYAFFRFSDYRRAKEDITLRKQPHQPGADVAWKEMAEYLYELASELGSVG